MRKIIYTKGTTRANKRNFNVVFKLKLNIIYLKICKLNNFKQLLIKLKSFY